MKLNYIIFPLITLLVSISGGAFTKAGLRTWYRKLKKPDFTPRGDFIGSAWTAIYVLSTISALIVWNSQDLGHSDPLFIYLFAVFALNALMNVFWSFLFFTLHMIGMAALESAALGLSVLALILFSYPISALAAALLVPYFAWVCFATYLNYSIWQLNK